MGVSIPYMRDAATSLGAIPSRTVVKRSKAATPLPSLLLDAHLAWCDQRIAAHLKADAQARQAEQLIGVGPVTASAVVATRVRHGIPILARFTTARPIESRT